MGEIAGLLTALCWALSATIFTECGKRMNDINVVNRTRLFFAVCILMTANLIFNHEIIPLNAGWHRWFWLGTSGLMGLAIGDTLMFQAYMMIGTRIAMLITAFSPIIGALIAWFFLGEKLGGGTMLGIMLAIAGVAVVVLDRGNIGNSSGGRNKFLLGIVISFLAVVAYAVGTVMSKYGLSGGFPPISGAIIRLLCAAVITWIPTIFRRKVSTSIQKVYQNRSTLLLIVAGSFLGPSTGIWLSFVAIQNTYVGVASTMISMAPIFLLPISVFVLKEKVGIRAIIGTLLAIAGVAVIFLV
jgi:drug/metabolite transporter (DMT)-like permease